MRSMTESDGFYNYLGFAPGTYTAMIDTGQLSRLDFISEPVKIDFEIRPLSFGDIVDDVSFTLIKITTDQTEASNPIIETQKPTESSEKPVKQTEKAVEKQTKKEGGSKPAEVKPLEVKTEISGPIKIISGNINPEAGPFFVQAGAFETYGNADHLANSLCRLSQEKCGIIKEGNIYKVRLGYFTDARSANICLKRLNEAGYPCFIGEVKGFKK